MYLYAERFSSVPETSQKHSHHVDNLKKNCEVFYRALSSRFHLIKCGRDGYRIRICPPDETLWPIIKHEPLNQCWFYTGPLSKKLYRH